MSINIEFYAPETDKEAMAHVQPEAPTRFHQRSFRPGEIPATSAGSFRSFSSIPLNVPTAGENGDLPF